MKSKRFSDGVLFLLAVIGVSAFFLPWIKLKTPWDPSLKKLADSLQEQTDAQLEWQDFISLNEFQRETILNDPWQGISGYQLFLDLRQDSNTSEASRYFASQFLGSSTIPEKAYLLVLLACLPALVVGLNLMIWKRPRTLVYVGIGLLLFYLIFRWKIAVTEGVFLAVGMPIGIGLWLIIYCLLLVSLLFLSRAAFPKSKL